MAFDEDKDATITTSYIQKRGYMLGLEYRQKLSKSVGWEIQSEFIKDHFWINQTNARETLVNYYQKAF